MLESQPAAAWLTDTDAVGLYTGCTLSNMLYTGCTQSQLQSQSLCTATDAAKYTQLNMLLPVHYLEPYIMLPVQCTQNRATNAAAEQQMLGRVVEGRAKLTELGAVTRVASTLH